MTDYRAWPKLDLHRHMEGAIRPETFRDIVESHGIQLPPGQYAEFEKNLQICPEDAHTLTQFLTKFTWLRYAMPDRESIARIAYEFVEDAARDGVRYVELRFNPGRLFQRGIAQEDVIGGICEGVALAESRYPIDTGLICGIARDMDVEMAGIVADFAVKYHERGIVGFDIMGDEITPPAPFVPAYRKAADAGIHLTAHAGEAGTAQNIIDSIEMLHVSRIGHGTHIFGDRRAAELAAEKGILVEACLTSNVQTGAVAALEEHPLNDLLKQGIAVCLNTDDPSVSGNLTLSEEYALASTQFGVSDETLRRMLESEVKHIFRTDLIGTLQCEMAAFFDAVI